METRGAGLARGPGHGIERRFAVSEAREDRGAEDPRVESGVTEHAKRSDSLPRCRRPRLGLTPHVFTEGRDAEIHGDVFSRVELLEGGDIANDHRALRYGGRPHRKFR